MWCPERSVAWEHINRVPEQLKAVCKDTDKTPCARDKLSPDKDLVLRQECVSESAAYLYTYKRHTVCP